MLELLVGISVLLTENPKKIDGIVYDYGGKRYYWNVERKFKKAEVFFDFDSAILKKEEIHKLKTFDKNDEVVVKGYASPEGTKKYNLRLSEKRAKAVAEYLRKRGVKVYKIKAIGEDGCKEKKENWWKCRKAEVIEVE